MREFVPALDSEYIIDGARMELTPRQILEEAVGEFHRSHPAANLEHDDYQTDIDKTTGTAAEPLIDESVDPSPESNAFSSEKIFEYLGEVTSSTLKPRNIPRFFPEETTRAEIATGLIRTIWKTGHFRLDDLIIDITWEWETSEVGDMTAFYKSVEAACSYLDMLDIRLGGYHFQEVTGTQDDGKTEGCRIKFNIYVEKSENIQSADDSDEPIDIAETIDREIMNTPDMNPALPLCELPFRTSSPVLGKSRKCQVHVSDNTGNWLIYIPFDTCKFRLGGSLLAEKTGLAGGKAPDIMDSDYFIDCFEVVREFVEDGVIVSGAATGPGGLIATLNRMSNGMTAGIDADISGICRSYGETDITRILFSEVPGAVVEIRDSDFDYVDAEMLLQDVAYYPIGHPGKPGLRITSGNQDGVAGILQSLLGQEDIVPEGED